MSEDFCGVCNKRGHAGRDCKAPFSKRWPGRHALKMLVRDKTGSTFEIACKITPEMYAELSALQLDILRRIRPAEDVG